jgi:hypothetical protein
LFVGLATGLRALQGKPCKIGVTEMLGADRIAAGLVEEFLFERIACWRCGCGAIFAVRPFDMGCNGRA